MLNRNYRSIFFILFTVLYASIAIGQQVKKGTINRKELVRRHNLLITGKNQQGPSQVGNGNFAFGFDVTGMQTLTDKFTTMSHWGWHSMPLPSGNFTDNFKLTNINSNCRTIPYELPEESNPEISKWRAANPHRFNLARIGLLLRNENGDNVDISVIQDASQSLDLWTGIAVSTFKIGTEPVKVTTVADPNSDQVAFRIESRLIKRGLLGTFLEFPYASLGIFSNGSDFTKPELHQTALLKQSKRGAVLMRALDSTNYIVKVRSSEPIRLSKEEQHRYSFYGEESEVMEFVVSFAKDFRQKASSFLSVYNRSKDYWPRFWNSGGAIDLSLSLDQRWEELERRIVLSQYIMKINASGIYPPQETGLVSNSWYGRFHYEMILWNSAHHALWNRWDLLNNSIHIYQDNLQSAKERATSQGFLGARYPKCTGPDGREWPHPIHAFLLWQQPHPIFFADLDYRAHPTKKTLKKWLPLIKSTADFIASYPVFDSINNRYNLDGPIAFVPENNNYYTDKNPAFELGYWRYALRTAQRYNERANLPPNNLWKGVASKLAVIPVQGGRYVQWEGIIDMWTKYNFEHPALLGVFGLLPGDGVDKETMNRTLDQVIRTWKFDSMWGWDFPLMAMTAARLGRPHDAIDMLLDPSPKNGFDVHGFVGGGNPYPYIPTNGGLLYAVALMTAGWDGDSGIPEPGFPKDGNWRVRWEGLNKAL